MDAFYLDTTRHRVVERPAMDMRSETHAVFYLSRFHTRMFRLCYMVASRMVDTLFNCEITRPNILFVR